MTTPKPARTLITAALPYANGPLHIGHLAGAYLPADIYTRWLKLKGEDAIYVCGSDEYGAAIAIRARREGTTPQAIVDQYHALIRDTFARFGIQFDIYSRTSEPIHHETAQGFFRDFVAKGLFDEQESEQYYDEEAKIFLADRYIIGTCPVCANENAYGDQCERCGTSLSPSELKNPRSALSGNSPVLRSTKHWYLPLEKFEARLTEYIKSHEGDWKTHVYQQCMSWLKQGLHPRAMTRDLDWGIPVPVKGAEGKVLYVWFDAPIGYISATKIWAADRASKDKRYSADDWKRYWQHNDTRLLHFIGKDNIVFHCLIFPAILQQHGDYIWADNVPANEFLNLEGEKLSTSRNHAIWLHEFIDKYPNRIEALRYYLACILPETKDADFTWREYQTRNNSELVAILGNFVHRTLSLVQRYCGGRVPQKHQVEIGERLQLGYLRSKVEDVDQAVQSFKFREALAHVMDIARAGNKYLAETEPWKAIKTENGEQKVETILYYSLQVCAALAVVLEPFLPETAKNLNKLLGQEKQPFISLKGNEWIAPGRQLPEAEMLFTRIEDEEIKQELDALIHRMMEKNYEVARSLQSSNAWEPLKSQITYEQFEPLDLRVGQILEAAPVKGADRLLQLKVDLGFEVRTIVSGIAEHFKPEEVKGRKVVVLANLAPRKLRGIESQGMILTAEGADGKLQWVAPCEESQLGSVVK
jgi:methionyl-tRNA synthetase